MAPRRRNKSFQILTGLNDVDALLKEMKTSSGNRAARSGLTAACRLGVKLAKKRVPSTKKDVKKSIGFRVRADKGGPSKGVTRSKFGAGVGKKQAALKSRGRRKGVGIGARNIHWWVMGTDDRVITGTSGGSWPPAGHPTGRMPASPVIRETWNAHRGQIEDTLRKKTLEAIDREWNKLAAKGM